MLLGGWLLYLKSGVRLVPIRSGWMVILSMLFIAGLIASNSRSGLLGVVLAVVVLMSSRRIYSVFRNVDTYRSHILSASARAARALLIGMLVVTALVGLTIYAFTVRETEILEDTRFLVTWRAYLPIIWNNPLGLPGGADLIQAMDQSGTIEHALALERSGGRIIAPHNLLLTTGVSYGPVAAVALFFLYFSAFRDARRAFVAFQHQGCSRESLWVVLLIAVNVAIFTHSWFHNASIAMGEMRNWLWVGLLFLANNPQDEGR